MTADAQPVADSAAVQPRRIVARTKGRRNDLAVRLMSPSDFFQLLKPIALLDFKGGTAVAGQMSADEVLLVAPIGQGGGAATGAK